MLDPHRPPDGSSGWGEGTVGALLYLDREALRAAILLSDVAVSGNEIGNRVLTQK